MKQEPHMQRLDIKELTLDRIQQLLGPQAPALSLSEASRAHIEAGRAYLDARLARGGEVLYGINTGFGYLCDRQIAPEDLRQLQLNLIRSHACGLGDEVPADLVRLMLLLKIKSLALGHSGVQLATVERLLDFFNHDVLPVVYTQGSLGASGDLAPLAHLSLPLLGEGEVRLKGEKMPAAQALRQMGWK
ncbi:MAG: aromatic amino acid lyase, partial [Bacteroidetes bacterium]